MINQRAKKAQKKLFLKIAFILLLILLLMIPNALIQELINERQGLEAQTQHEIASSWGPNQRIVGPVLSIPFTRKHTDKDGVTFVDYQLRVLPKDVNIRVDVLTEERKKSIYKAILYSASNEIDGAFDIPEKANFGKNVTQIHWDDATIDIGFTSSASLDHIVNFKWGDTQYVMKSGASDNELFQSGIHTSIKIDPAQKTYAFESEIGIKGSKAIYFLPLASHTTMKMTSNWPSPGFVGLPLPKSRDISDSGFSAQWTLTEYNRPFKGMWEDDEINLQHQGASFGVNLVQTIGHYQKNMRSAKYAILIMGLSFLVFFFFEILKAYRIHPIQYIFIGMALSIFYTLLLSLSEHVGFGFAYLIATLAVVGLIGWYSRFMLKQGSNVMMLVVLLSILYAYIYVLLQMEEFALLVGSVGLFVVLAIVMYLSRHMNWYAVNDGSDQ